MTARIVAYFLTLFLGGCVLFVPDMTFNRPYNEGFTRVVETLERYGYCKMKNGPERCAGRYVFGTPNRKGYRILVYGVTDPKVFQELGESISREFNKELTLNEVELWAYKPGTDPTSIFVADENRIFRLDLTR